MFPRVFRLDWSFTRALPAPRHKGCRRVGSRWRPLPVWGTLTSQQTHQFVAQWHNGYKLTKTPMKEAPHHFDKPQPVGRPEYGAPKSIVSTGTLKFCWDSPLPRQSQPISFAPTAIEVTGTLYLWWDALSPFSSWRASLNRPWSWGSISHMYPASDTIWQPVVDLDYVVYLRTTEMRTSTLIDNLTLSLVQLLVLCLLGPDLPFQQGDRCLSGMVGQQVVLLFVVCSQLPVSGVSR